MNLVHRIISCCIVLCCNFAILARSNHVIGGAGGDSGSTSHAVQKVKIGLLLDLSSSLGKMMESCVKMAHSDFYQSHPNYRTRLLFRTKNSGGVLEAASGATELLKNDEVRAILGPQTIPEAKFVIELGAKHQVPIVSFSATSSSLSPDRNPYFLRVAGADSSQSKAIAAIVQGFGWKEIVIVYEDTGYQDGFIKYISDASREAGIQISLTSAIFNSASDSQLADELQKLKEASSKVFLVHMTPLLGSRFFVHANTTGMMSEGYAWLTTDGLSNFFSSMDSTVIDAMQGVLGIRPYVAKSTYLTAFRMRWERELQCTQPKAELNIFGLWAYDAAWALAMAIEKMAQRHNADLFSSSEVGLVLLKEIMCTRFKGLSGDFNLVNGQLQISAFEMLNVIGKGERPIGYWTPERGLSRDPDSDNGDANYSTSVNVLRSIIWPGDSTVKPMYWAIPTSGRRLKVWDLVKEGFSEFVKLRQFKNTREYVFRELLTHLPFKIDNLSISLTGTRLRIKVLGVTMIFSHGSKKSYRVTKE